jgi:hypothetical protein
MENDWQPSAFKKSRSNLQGKISMNLLEIMRQKILNNPPPTMSDKAFSIFVV